MNTDATPSWSGYIFQGEVALCRAIETINTIKEPIPDNYCLKLEEDEDFSIQTDEIEVFQVKAYLSKNSDKISKYKPVIEELINKYYYSKQVLDDEDDGRKKIHLYSIRARKKPIKCNLLTDKVITDFPTNLSTFSNRFSVVSDNFECIQGVYTVTNIYEKLKDAIEAYCSDASLTDQDIAAKASYCCLKITRIVKERHTTKRKEKILFKDIIKWIRSPLAFSEDLCWYEISKLFLNFLSEGLDDYDLSDEDQKNEFEKINFVIEELENLPYDDLVSLIQFYITPHKILDKKNLRQSFGSFLESAAVKYVILKAIRQVIPLPSFKQLQYTKTGSNGEPIRYQLLNHNDEFDNSVPQQIQFQKHCEKFYRHPGTIDVDLFVTRHLSYTPEQVEAKIINILNPHDTAEDRRKGLFGFLSIDETINEINE